MKTKQEKEKYEKDLAKQEANIRKLQSEVKENEYIIRQIEKGWN